MKLIFLVILTVTSLIGMFLAAPPVFAQACSEPYYIEQPFPVSGPEETRWKLCWRMARGNGLIVAAAYFRPSPQSRWIEVLDEARVSEIFVPYHEGSKRILDVTSNYLWVTLNEKHCSYNAGGRLLNGGEVCRQLRERGLAWSDDQESRRGEDLVLWGILDAYNYDYVIEWTFQDDGAILGRVGATGRNLNRYEQIGHTHGVFWRLDLDLNGPTGNSVHLGKHTETGLKAVDSESAIKKERGIRWNPLTYDTLHIHDKSLKNAQGHASAYHLMPIRTGTPRHREPFTHYDFWVTKSKRKETTQIEETAAILLPSFVSPAESVTNTDVVVWYYGSLHHLVRDEDGIFVDKTWQGKTHIMWTGFMLKPHNLFDKTPLFTYPTEAQPDTTSYFISAEKLRKPSSPRKAPQTKSRHLPASHTTHGVVRPG